MLPSKLTTAIDWLDQQTPSIVDQVTRWCEQNSWSNNAAGLIAMADRLQRDFALLELPCQRSSIPSWTSLGDGGEPIEHLTGPLLLWHHQPEASHRILLLIHYDTVYPPGSLPTGVVHTADNRLIGPGVADAKGGIAVILYAMQAILKYNLAPNVGVTIALNPDEEVGTPSSAGLLQELAQQFDFALVFEPTLPDGALVANRKGTANFHAIVQGRSAHAGRNINEGRNAVVHAARLAVELDSWNHPSSGISVNVGRISGGGPLNQVPSLATLSFNIRVETNAAAEEVISRLKPLENQFCVDGYDCVIRGHFHSPPKVIVDNATFDDVRQRVVTAMRMAGREVAWRDTGGACDGNKLAAFGLPNIDSMGPTGGNLHSPAEYCEVGSFIAAAKTMVHLIANAGSET